MNKPRKGESTQHRVQADVIQHLFVRTPEWLLPRFFHYYALIPFKAPDALMSNPFGIFMLFDNPHNE
jgi:hypothetical protein